MQTQAKKVTGLRGKYIYALAPGDQPREYGSLGINGGHVYTISNGKVAAVVSDVPNQKIRPERRHFAAHQAVLKKLMEEGPVLPMTFGMISSGHKAVMEILSRNSKAVGKQLARVAGKVEMGLRVSWDVANIFEYLVNTHPDLRAARDRLLAANRNLTQDEKIELGHLFETVLNTDRERHYSSVEAVLEPCCTEIKSNKCRAEREVMNLACLVARDSLKEFEAGIFEAARLFDDNFAFDYNGPWAPHNFVNLEITL
jgi:hypothetical protein